MKDKFVRFVTRHGGQLCALAFAVAPVVSGWCRILFYQPEEPEGFAEFVSKHSQNK